MSDINDKPLLAFDCSVPCATLALQTGGQTTTHTLQATTQASLLVPEILQLMRAQQVQFSELGALLTTLGPGSFTGLRIALAALHGFALAHGLAVRTTTSLQATAWGIRHGGPFTVALNAGKGEVFVQQFDASGAPLGDICLQSPDLIAQDDCYSNLLDPSHARYVSGPQAATLCAHAGAMQPTDLSDVLPLYIRPPDAKRPAVLPWLQTT